MTKDDVLKVLPKGTLGIFSTINEKGMPDGRGWQFQFEENNKFYFITGNNKDVFKEMKINPNAAFTVMEPTGKYTVRITGKATFLTDASEKEKAFAKLTDQVKGLYQSWDNPAVEIFYLSQGELKLAEGFNPPAVVSY